MIRIEMVMFCCFDKNEPFILYNIDAIIIITISIKILLKIENCNNEYND